jgi:hypothetical protein
VEKNSHPFVVALHYQGVEGQERRGNNGVSAWATRLQLEHAHSHHLANTMDYPNHSDYSDRQFTNLHFDLSQTTQAQNPCPNPIASPRPVRLLRSFHRYPQSKCSIFAHLPTRAAHPRSGHEIPKHSRPARLGGGLYKIGFCVSVEQQSTMSLVPIVYSFQMYLDLSTYNSIYYYNVYSPPPRGGQPMYT